MLKSLFNDFLEDLAKDAVKLINKFLVDLMDIALNCQNYISTKHLIKGLSLSKVNAVILKYAIALLILKFVQKGFSIYILQSDGDPDHDPIHILTGFCQAVAISVTFLGLYTPLVNIFETFTKAILTAIGSKGEIEAIKDQFLLTLFGNGITTVLLFIIFLIIIFLIYIQIIKNGAELMVLKFAIPLLSVGLMDSDGDCWEKVSADGIYLYIADYFASISYGFIINRACNLVCSIWIIGIKRTEVNSGLSVCESR